MTPTIEMAVLRVRTAWEAYKPVERHGLEFGEALCTLRDVLKSQGKKGEGLLPRLEQVGIPTSTAYFWMNRYQVSVGQKQAKILEQPSPELKGSDYAHLWLDNCTEGALKACVVGSLKGATGEQDAELKQATKNLLKEKDFRCNSDHSKEDWRFLDYIGVEKPNVVTYYTKEELASYETRAANEN